MFFFISKKFHPPTGHIHHLATARAAVARPRAFASSRVHFCLAVLPETKKGGDGGKIKQEVEVGAGPSPQKKKTVSCFFSFFFEVGDWAKQLFVGMNFLFGFCRLIYLTIWYLCTLKIYRYSVTNKQYDCKTNIGKRRHNDNTRTLNSESSPGFRLIYIIEVQVKLTQQRCGPNTQLLQDATCNAQMSNGKKTWLFSVYMGWNTTHLYRDYNKPS